MVEDMDIIYDEIDYVIGIFFVFGFFGNLFLVIVYGVYRGMKVVVKVVFGIDFFEGKIIVVQGVGNVVYNLCCYLYEEGVNLIVMDINKQLVQCVVEDFGVCVVDLEEIYL